MLSRRELLKALGLGAAAVALPTVVKADEPEEKIVDIPVEQIILDDYDEPVSGTHHHSDDVTVTFENTKTHEKTVFKCDQANLTYTEHSDYDFVQWDCGDPVFRRELEHQPLEVSINFMYNYVSGQNWNHDIKSGLPGDVDLIFETKDEQLRFPGFVWENMNHDLSAGMLEINGRCMGELCHTKR
jgi:hypothetical protein